MAEASFGAVVQDSCGAVSMGRASGTDAVCACGLAFLLVLCCLCLIVHHSKYVVQILPSMVVAPVFFKGNMEMGAISQT